MKKTINIISAIAFCMYLATIALLCFTHGNKLPDIGGTWFGLPADKVAHAIMFLPFIPLSFFTFRRQNASRLRGILLATTLLALGAGTAYLTEIIQEKYCYRTYDMADFASDCTGLCVGYMFVSIWIFLKRTRKRS